MHAGSGGTTKLAHVIGLVGNFFETSNGTAGHHVDNLTAVIVPSLNVQNRWNRKVTKHFFFFFFFYLPQSFDVTHRFSRRSKKSNMAQN